MKIYFAAAILSLALAGTANAAITVSLASGNNATFNNNPVGAMSGFSAAWYNGGVGQIEFEAGSDTTGVSIGTTPGTSAMPLGDNTNYLWGLREGTTVYFGSKANPVATNSFIINWGSIDALLVNGYDNVLQLSNGNVLTGQDLVNLGLAVGNGNQFNPLNNRWFLIRDDQPFTSFTAFSARNAFEFDMTTAVPEPGTWALMIAGFGMVGFAARRRTAEVQAEA